MFEFDKESSQLIGPGGTLSVPPGDDALLKLAMLLQGECTDVGPLQAARNFNYSKARYFQIRSQFLEEGSQALIKKKPGPKRNYRRTPEVIKKVIRKKFLDHESSPEVIASRIRQDGDRIATRSVERIITEYGLQKKTPHPLSRKRSGNARNTKDQDDTAD